MPAATWRAIWRSIRQCEFHGHAEKVEDRAKDQIEYPREDPFIRSQFEEELAKRGIKSEMPAECYSNPEYEWSKAMGKQ